MKCPYCHSAVDALATVCATCKRDLYLVQSLQSRVVELEAALSKAGHAAGSPPAPGVIAPADHVQAGSALPKWVVWVAAAVALVLAHLLIVIVFDLPNMWLRVATLFIPIPFSYFAARTSGRGFAWNLCCAIAVSVAAVVTMSAVVSTVDGTSTVPDSRVSRIEFIQYVASIGFSFATGLLLGAGHAKAIGRVAMPLLRWLLNTRVVTPEVLQKKMEIAHKILVSVTAIGTTAASIVTGLHHMIGK